MTDWLDERCVFRLWTTSSPEVQARYAREIALGRAAYDAPPNIGPRDRVIRCGNPSCGAPVVVRADQGGMNRGYCDEACRSLSYYYRHRDVRLASMRAYRARKAGKAA